MSVRVLVACVFVVLTSSLLPAQADVIWLQREDVGVRFTLTWKGFDGKQRTDTDTETATLRSGESDSVGVAVQAIPSEGDNTVASYGASYRRFPGFIEANVAGAIVEGQPESELVQKHELGFVLTFKVEGQGVQLFLSQFRGSGAIGAVDFVLYSHTQQHTLAAVTNNQEATDFGSFILVDGGKYTLAVRLSSTGLESLEYGFNAFFESPAEGEVPIQPAP